MAPRPSRQLGYKAAQTIYYAIGEQADRIGLPLNYWVTINFSDAGVDPRLATGLFGKLRNDRFGKWATRPRARAGRAVTPTYAYVFENVRDKVAYESMEPGDPHNVHAHWLVHIPPERYFDFRNRVVEWLDELTGAISPANAVHIEAVTDAIGARSYALKGAAGWAKHFGARPEDQGLIIGRRSGTSVNLGVGVRRRMDRAQGIRRQAA